MGSADSIALHCTALHCTVLQLQLYRSRSLPLKTKSENWLKIIGGRLIAFRGTKEERKSIFMYFEAIASVYELTTKVYFFLNS
jgi:hypothetical protein